MRCGDFKEKRVYGGEIKMERKFEGDGGSEVNLKKELLWCGLEEKKKVVWRI